MKILELLSIICFLVAASAGEDSYGGAILLLCLCGIFAFLSAVLPKHRKRGRK